MLATGTGLSASQQQAVADASAQATSSGQPVSVDSLTTSISTLTAEPNGQLSWSSSVMPQRVQKNGAWADIDTTLKQNASGTYAPAAAPGSLVLSGGGSGPLVTIADSAGRDVSLYWPSALPTPTVSGSTLTYPSVFPDVDLQVSATPTGGITDVLVVKTAAAASNPALSSLKLTTHTQGVTVTDDGHGTLSARSADGQVQFQAPSPLMWDSTSTSSGAATSKVAALDASTAADTPGPGEGAQVAPVDAQVDGSTITLTPDQKLLTGSSTTYPVYIDPPDWSPLNATGNRQMFTEVQSACPSTPHVNDTSYGYPGVGDNTFTGCIGLERSYFQIAVPHNVWGASIVSATANVQETYSASCSTSNDIKAYLTSPISSATNWNNKPALGTYLGAQTFGSACSSWPSGGYDITSNFAKAAANDWGTYTFALVNSNESDGAYFRRFNYNPTITIVYDHAPNPPGYLSANAGSTTLGCATTTPYPLLGKTDSVTAPTLNAQVSDPDKDQLDATFTYWINGSTTKHTLVSAVTSSGKTASQSLPSGFVSGLADGTTVDWQVSASDGHLSTTRNETCHFTAYPNTPVLRLAVKSAGTSEGSSSVYTATTDASDKAVKYVWNLDVAPPVSNPPANQTVTADSSGTASITVTPASPGTHTLYVTAYDAASNTAGTSATFSVNAAAGSTYSSLAAAFDNTAVTATSNAASGNADGASNSLPLEDLQAAGWNPGSTVHINGASLTLPNYGNGKPDNVLADNQTISLPAQSGGLTKGSAVVFLGFSTYALQSDTQRADDDSSTPFIPPTTDTSGTNCTFTNGSSTDCADPTGTIQYSDGSTGTYYLRPPDWVDRPDGATDNLTSPYAVLTLAHRHNPSGTFDGAVNLYAITVHLDSSKTVSSITLPDVSGSARQGFPALHILAMNVRDTTSAAGGASWTGAWASPTETTVNFQGADWKDQTIRTALTPTVTGSSTRIHLSNAQGTSPITLDHVTLAAQNYQSSAKAAPVAVTFDGASSITLPAGADIYSDPVSFPVTAGQNLLVSSHLTGDVPYLVEHTWATDGYTWVTAAGSGDHTADTAAGAFTGTGTKSGAFTNILTGVDVTASAGSEPTLAVLGDGLVDPFSSTASATIGSRRLSRDIADDLADPSRNTWSAPQSGVVGAGIQNNSLNQDTLGYTGLAALTRLDRDVLSEPGLTTVVIEEGLHDTLGGVDEGTQDAADLALKQTLADWGITAIFTTQTPCDGYAACTSTVDATRASINQDIQDMAPPPVGTGPYTYAYDADGAIAAIDSTNLEEQLNTQGTNSSGATVSFDAGDHVNLTNDGYQAVADGLLNTTDLLPPSP
ncbi:hypothetical protein [Phaeacidiphilus oryzae]|uniref:hypothetical protein n=1 Tax=Phaeacidiphilus oryzae TaxID=348818 RepID=UPI000691C9D0|nr:hypothetical protein [Phaeacidiphilus oryzae]